MNNSSLQPDLPAIDDAMLAEANDEINEPLVGFAGFAFSGFCHPNLIPPLDFVEPEGGCFGFLTGAGAGVAPGREDGAGVGRPLGAGVGREVGAGVGREVGAGVGREMGAGVGREVGAGVGREDGAGVGREVGAGVGREAADGGPALPVGAGTGAIGRPLGADMGAERPLGAEIGAAGLLGVGAFTGVEVAGRPDGAGLGRLTVVGVGRAVALACTSEVWSIAGGSSTLELTKMM